MATEKEEAKERLTDAAAKFKKARKDAGDRELMLAGHDVAVAQFFAEEAGVPQEVIDGILEQ